MIKIFASRINKSLGSPVSTKFSNGWLEKFLKRNSIRHYKFHGEAASKDEAKKKAQTRIEELRIITSKYNPDLVFNADELGLFYNMKPSTSYIFDFEANSSKGLKKEKSRITVLLSANSTGEIKIPVYIIGFNLFI